MACKVGLMDLSMDFTSKVITEAHKNIPYAIPSNSNCFVSKDICVGCSERSRFEC